MKMKRKKERKENNTAMLSLIIKWAPNWTASPLSTAPVIRIFLVNRATSPLWSAAP